MDEQTRRLERDAVSGDAEAIAKFVRARRRAGEEVRVPRDGDRVRGEHLGALLVGGLSGRREVDILRMAGVPERRLARLIDAFRALARGEVRVWSAVREWAPLLGLDVGDLALVAEVVPVPPAPPRRAAAPHPLATLPNEPCCGHCRSMVWAIGCGAGVRCSNPASTVGLGGPIPGLHSVCPAYSGPMFDASS